MTKVRQSLVVWALGVLCFSTGALSRSVSMIGDIKIDISDNQFQCDKINCPINTSYCVVTKEKDRQNATVVTRLNACYSSTNGVLADLVTKETIDANSNVQVHIRANRNGITSMSNSYSSSGADFDAEKFNKEFTQQMTNFNHQFSKQMQNLQQNMNQMQQNLANLFHRSK